jgi:hypothetical protein
VILEIIFQGTVAVLATAVSIFQIRNGLPKSRSLLRQDLEIFTLLNPNDQYYDLVKNSITKDIESIYTPKKDKYLWYKLNYQKIDFVIGILSFFIGTSWTIFLVSQKTLSTWLIVSIILILGGLGELLVSLGDRQRNY